MISSSSFNTNWEKILPLLTSLVKSHIWDLSSAIISKLYYFMKLKAKTSYSDIFQWMTSKVHTHLKQYQATNFQASNHPESTIFSSYTCIYLICHLTIINNYNVIYIYIARFNFIVWKYLTNLGKFHAAIFRLYLKNLHFSGTVWLHISRIRNFFIPITNNFYFDVRFFYKIYCNIHKSSSNVNGTYLDYRKHNVHLHTTNLQYK